MSKKKGIPEKFQIWIDVRKRYRLSDVHIQMARELGMNQPIVVFLFPLTLTDVTLSRT
jgi:hypothetical protein